MKGENQVLKVSWYELECRVEGCSQLHMIKFNVTLKQLHQEDTIYDTISASELEMLNRAYSSIPAITALLDTLNHPYVV
jgi:hypothetical protein